ncbi:MAG: hypothetical protein GQ525_04275 [Draconibacterium sp.]|nr:hypothetical protein [Draconibacterium sp.]
MKKSGFILLLEISFIAFLTSCLGFDDEPVVSSQRAEQAELATYINDLVENGYNIDTTDFGLYYIILEEGEGEFPQEGDSLEVGYAGYYVDGTLFDASDELEENGTLEFVLGSPPMITGWDKGMELINKNAKVQLIVSSQFAYGSTGSGNIPPYKTLIFVVKMIDLHPSL